MTYLAFIVAALAAVWCFRHALAQVLVVVACAWLGFALLGWLGLAGGAVVALIALK